MPLLSAAQLLLTATIGTLPDKPVAATAAPSDFESQEMFSPDGTITRIRVPLRRNTPVTAPFDPGAAAVIPIQETGPAGERFNLVYVGDGYTRDELGSFHEHVLTKWEELASVEPFSTYRDYFDVWEVDVASPESGVTNDPDQGVQRTTALGMYFWCGDVERLLCADQNTAAQYAGLAPGVNQIVALGNTVKYGGSGGGLAVAAAGNEDAGQIIVHELGHSIGGLADEYDYPYDYYQGGEVSEPNVSIYTDDVLEQSSVKWFRWLGEESPDGGIIGSFDGARFYSHGINRPSEDSIMRTLGHPYNLPGREAITEAILSKTNPVTALPEDRSINSSISLSLVDPVDSPHDVRWYLDGTEIADWSGSTEVDPTDLDVVGNHELAVDVSDTSGFVQDPNFTATTLTLSWPVAGS
jgi:hypothetical protein